MLAEDDLVIGFVGLGIMGKGMVHNLVQKLPVSTTFVLWNRTTSIADKVAHEFPDRKVCQSNNSTLLVCV